MIELVLTVFAVLSFSVVLLVREKLRLERDQAAVARAMVAAEAAVLEVEQTYRKPRRGQPLTAGEAEDALMRAVEAAEDSLGPRGMAEQRRLLGAGDEDVERWLTSLIEAEVGRMR